MNGRGKLLLLKALQRAGPRLGRHFTVTHGDARIRVPIVDGIGLEHASLPDPNLLPILKRSLALREGAFVDVGAHLGETLMKLLATGERRPYLGIEPQAQAAAYVERLLAANDYPGEVITAALGDRNGAAILRITEELDDSASIVEGFRSSEGTYRERVVPLMRGDDALDAAGVGRVALLKIDAEGAESEVLDGLVEMIDRDRPIILCEVLPVYDETSPPGRLRRERSDAVVAFATEHGYRLVRIRDSGLELLEGIETHADFSLREYVLLPDTEDGSALLL